MAIPAIPTMYKGIQFRSRLEARWATFFDLCGWKWDYEPEDLAGYIPDFMLHFDKGDVLAEVKPSNPSDDHELAQAKIFNGGWRGAAAGRLGLR